MPRAIIKVSFDMPEGADYEDAVKFVDDGVYTIGGCYHPDHPFFPRPDNIEVVPLYKKDRQDA